MESTQRTQAPSRLLKVVEFARFVGLSERSIWAAIASGQVAVVRLGRRATRIEEAELVRFIERARAAGTR